VAGLNVNIPVNARECFRLTDFWPSLIFGSSSYRDDYEMSALFKVF
jgi:hypothetical protein